MFGPDAEQCCEDGHLLGISAQASIASGFCSALVVCCIGSEHFGQASAVRPLHTVLRIFDLLEASTSCAICGRGVLTEWLAEIW